MKASSQISRCRQGLGEDVGEVRGLVRQILQRASLVRASLYWRERQCGKQGCCCQKGKLHRSRAISVRRDGQSRVISLRGIDLLKVSSGIGQYQRFQEKFRKIKQLMAQIEQKVEILGKLQEVDLERFRS